MIRKKVNNLIGNLKFIALRFMPEVEPKDSDCSLVGPFDPGGWCPLKEEVIISLILIPGALLIEHFLE
jgi:hypothetical protein